MTSAFSVIRSVLISLKETITKYNQTYFMDKKKNENKKSTIMIATPILLKKLCSFEGQARVLEKYLHEGAHTVYLVI